MTNLRSVVVRTSRENSPPALSPTDGMEIEFRSDLNDKIKRRRQDVM
jgi:hypothetical protein